MHNLAYYPEPSGLALKKALAEHFRLDERQIILGNGSAELIYLCTRMFYRNRVLVLEPSFSEYGRGVENPCIVRIGLDLNHISLPREKIAEALQADDLLFITNPNNPTGNLFCREELIQLLELVKERQARLVVDETFIDFLGDSTISLRDISSQEPNLIILGSLTKFYALPGLRIGYALTTPDNTKKMEQLLPPWRINSLALAAGVAALQDKEYIQRTISLIDRERELIICGLSDIEGLYVYPSQANFILVDARSRGFTAAELQEKLGPEGILIRDCSDFYNLSPYHFRLAVRNHEENEILLRTLRKVLN